MTELAFPKPRPRALLKEDRRKVKETIEQRENKKVKARSKGQCEVVEVFHLRVLKDDTVVAENTATHRCLRQAREIHHLLGGTGRRGVRESALAQNKLHVCSADHELITRHILQGSWTDVNDRAGTVTFVRLK